MLHNTIILYNSQNKVNVPVNPLTIEEELKEIDASREQSMYCYHVYESSFHKGCFSDI